MSAQTRYDADGNRDTVLNRARRFFLDNPDEMLTRDDFQVKFGCGPDMANVVARSLIREGVITRDQLPRPPWANGRADILAGQRQPFPLCLTPATALRCGGTGRARKHHSSRAGNGAHLQHADRPAAGRPAPRRRAHQR